jgi:flagellar basal-body rod protein FlgC
MDLIDTLNIAGQGLTAQRVRLQTISANMANAKTTRTEEGGPYQRRVPVFQARPVDDFGTTLEQALAGVEVPEVTVSKSEGQRVYQPDHPDADEDGYVTYPDIDILAEMVDLMTTQRTYEANAKVVDVTRELADRALDIGR